MFSTTLKLKLFGVLALGLGAGAFLYVSPLMAQETETAKTAEQQAEATADASPQELRPENGNATPSLRHVTAIRTLGSEDAPVVMEDYSSLSCPHCATFHNEILPQLKRDFVDTGKLKIQFFPMPLNEAALMGEKLVRCLPLDQYTRGLDILYKTQSTWAFTGNPKEALLEKAKMMDIPQATAQACLDNEEYDVAIIGVARERAVKHGVASTPTFIFNDGEQVLRGVGLYDRYQLLIEGMVEKAANKAQEDATAAEEDATTQEAAEDNTETPETSDASADESTDDQASE